MPVQNIQQWKDSFSRYDSKGWSKNIQLDGAHVEVPTSSQEKKTSFSSWLAESLGEINLLQKEADMAIQKLVSGESKNIHETMLMLEKAEIAFKSMNQVRIKMIEAYKEIMRIQV